MGTLQSKLKKSCEFFNALLRRCSKCVILSMCTKRVRTGCFWRIKSCKNVPQRQHFLVPKSTLMLNMVQDLAASFRKKLIMKLRTGACSEINLCKIERMKKIYKRLLNALLLSTGIFVFYAAASRAPYRYKSLKFTQLKDLFLQNFQKPTNNGSEREAVENQLDRNASIILLWTRSLSSRLGLNKSTKALAHFDCGSYQCAVTRDRTQLTKSQVIVFNPRWSEGNSVD